MADRHISYLHQTVDSTVSRSTSETELDPDFEGTRDEDGANPPSVLVEPEVPDPFIVDDGENSDSSEDHTASDADGLADDNDAAADEDIVLAQSTILDASVTASDQQPILWMRTRIPAEKATVCM